MKTKLFEQGFVSALAAEMRREALTNLEITLPGGETLRLKRSGDEVVIPVDIETTGTTTTGTSNVTAKAVGLLVLNDPASGKAFVSPGDRVEAGAILALVRVDLLLRPVVSPVSGVVDAVLLTDGSDVHYGTPVFSLCDHDNGR